MKNENEFLEKLRLLLNDYGLKDVSIFATQKDNDEFYGLFCAEGSGSGSYDYFFRCLLNAGRGWQSAREKSKQILNEFEK